MKKNIFILAATLVSSQAFAIQEVPDSSINEIARTTMENGETVIRYNPEYCEELGDQVCHFFLSHEYGHIALEHTLGGDFTVEEENAADCWVTQNAPIDLSKAAYAYFKNEDNIEGDHDSSAQRAENLSNCPEEASISEKQHSSDNSNNQKQIRSRFNHYRADEVFATLERSYPQYFPESSFGIRYGVEAFYRGNSIYLKKYRNGSALVEYKGSLYFKIPVLGIDWTYSGPLY